MSGHNLLADCQQRTLAPPLNIGANAAPISVHALSVHALPVQCHYSTGTDVRRGSLETNGNRVLDIICLTWDE